MTTTQKLIIALCKFVLAWSSRSWPAPPDAVDEFSKAIAYAQSHTDDGRRVD